jgi:hypothetical protein
VYTVEALVRAGKRSCHFYVRVEPETFYRFERRCAGESGDLYVTKSVKGESRRVFLRAAAA